MNIRTFNQCFKNCLWLTGAYFSIHATYKILSYFTQKPKKHPFLIDNRLYLFNNFIYNRQDIINLGRNGLRDPNTSQILINPIVNDDGLSYEDDQLNNQRYENRTLKELITNITEKRSKDIPLLSNSFQLINK